MKSMHAHHLYIQKAIVEIILSNISSLFHFFFQIARLYLYDLCNNSYFYSANLFTINFYNQTNVHNKIKRTFQIHILY